MSTLLGEARVRIRPDTSGFEREAKSGLSGAAERLGGLVKKGLLAGGAVAGAAGMIGLRTAAQLETANIGFTTMLGSGEKAEAFLKRLSDFAAKTPFEFPDLQQAASKLIAVGTEAGRVLPIMEVLGDSTAAMGTGSEGINRAVMALQQMRVKGKVTGEEMLQLAEAGVPAWEALATQLGVTTGEAQKMVTDGKVSVDDLFTAIEKRQGKTLQRTKGMMKEQSATLSGLWSTLKDTVQMRLAEAIEPFIPTIKSAMEKAGPILDTVLAKFAEFSKDAIPVLKDVGANVKVAFDFLVKYRGPILAVVSGLVAGFAAFKALNAAKAIWLAAGAIKGLLVAAGPIGWISLALGAIVGGFILAYQKSERFREIVGGAMDKVREGIAVLKDIWDRFVSGFTKADAGGGIAGFFERLKMGILVAWPRIKAALAAGLTLLVGWIKEAVPPALVAIGEFLGDLVKWIWGTGLPWLGQTLASLGSKLVSWIVERAPGALGAIGTFLGRIVGWLLGTGLPRLVQTLAQLGWKLITWIAPRIPGMLVEIGKFLGRLTGWVLTTGIPTLVKSLWNLGVKGLKGLIDGLKDSDLGKIGSELLDNLGSGLTNFGDKVRKWAVRIKDKIVGEIKDLFGIHSPSRVMAELGGHMVSGLLQGLSNGQGAVRAMVQKVVPNPKALLGSIASGAQRLKGALGEVFGGWKSGGGGKDIVGLGRLLQAQGFHVSEHPAFGGVLPVHTKNSKHYVGRAIDVNADSLPGGEAMNLDRIAGMIRALGYQVIWRAPGHYDHLHAAYDRGGIANGLGYMPKATLKPERVLSPSQTRAFEEWMRGEHDAQRSLVGGDLVLQTRGDNVRDDLGEALFQLRRIRRGGVYATTP